MRNIFLLPTEDNSWLCLKDGELVNANDGGCMLGYDPPRWLTQHLYITSDEEIKEGVNQWYLDKFLNKPMNSGGAQYRSKQEVIILTTDPTLIRDGVQEIDDEFLEWFVKNPTCEVVEVEADWILESNVPNGYTTLFYNITIPQEEPKKCENCNQIIDKYGCACPKDSKQEQKQHLIDMMEMDEESGFYDEPKQETLEEAAENYSIYNEQINKAIQEAVKFGANWQAEKMYSEEDVEQIAKDAYAMGRNNILIGVFNKWLEQVKKK